MFMADEHRPVIWLAEIAALLRGPLIVQRSGSESTLTDETRFLQGGTGIVHPRASPHIITAFIFLSLHL